MKALHFIPQANKKTFFYKEEVKISSREEYEGLQKELKEDYEKTKEYSTCISRVQIWESQSDWDFYMLEYPL